LQLAFRNLHRYLFFGILLGCQNFAGFYGLVEGYFVFAEYAGMFEGQAAYFAAGFNIAYALNPALLLSGRFGMDGMRCR